MSFFKASSRSSSLKTFDSDVKTAADVESQSGVTTTIPKRSPTYEKTVQFLAERTALILPHNNLRNTSLECDALGLHYRLDTDTKGFRRQRVTQIKRYDARQEKDVIVAEWERNYFGMDRIRMQSAVANDFLPMRDVFKRSWGLPYTVFFDRTFVANGKNYVWKSRPLSLKLYCEDGGGEELIATSNGKRPIWKPRNGFVELFPGYENVLDHVVVHWAISKQRRWEAELIGHLLKILIFDVMITLLVDLL